MDKIVERMNLIMEKDLSTVYIAHCGETGLYKIGTSRRPKLRAYELRSGSAYEIKMVQLFRVYEPFARPFEKFLHTAFAHCRTHGEWFKLSGEELRWLAMHPCPFSVNLITSGPMVERANVFGSAR